MSVEDHEADQLLRAARSGDTASLGRLFELHRNYLALLVRVEIGPRLQAKVDPADVVQDALLAAHRDFAGFRGETASEFLAWLRKLLETSAAAVVRRYLGTQGRDPRLEQALAPASEQSSSVDGSLVCPATPPSAKAERREQAVLLTRALATLPAHYREVIIVHHLEGLTLAQTAERLSRTPDSVQKIWTRALLRLREIIGDG